MADFKLIRQKYRALKGFFDERARRLWAAAEVCAADRGGFRSVVQATGISSKTLARGLRDLQEGASGSGTRLRRPGGGIAAILSRLSKVSRRGSIWSICHGT